MVKIKTIINKKERMIKDEDRHIDYKFNKRKGKPKTINYAFTIRLDSVRKKKRKSSELFVRYGCRTLYKSITKRKFDKNFYQIVGSMNLLNLQNEMQRYLTSCIQLKRHQLRAKTEIKLVGDISPYKQQKVTQKIDLLTNEYVLTKKILFYEALKYKEYRILIKNYKERTKAKSRKPQTKKSKFKYNAFKKSILHRFLRKRIRILQRQLLLLRYRAQQFPTSYIGPNYRRRLLLKHTKHVITHYKKITENIKLLKKNYKFSPINKKVVPSSEILKDRQIQEYTASIRRKMIYKNRSFNKYKNNKYNNRNPKANSYKNKYQNNQTVTFNNKKNFTKKKSVKIGKVNRKKVRLITRKGKKNTLKELQVELYNQAVSRNRTVEMRELTALFITKLNELIQKQKKIKEKLNTKIQTIIKKTIVPQEDITKIKEKLDSISEIKTLSQVQQTINIAAMRQLKQLQTKVRLSVQPAKIAFAKYSLKKNAPLKLITAFMQKWLNRKEKRNQFYTPKGRYIKAKKYKSYIDGFFSQRMGVFVKGRFRIISRKGHYKQFSSIDPNLSYWATKYSQIKKQGKKAVSNVNSLKCTKYNASRLILKGFYDLRFVNTRSYFLKKGHKSNDVKSRSLKKNKTKLIKKILRNRKNQTLNQLLTTVNRTSERVQHISKQAHVTELFTRKLYNSKRIKPAFSNKRLKYTVAQFLLLQLTSSKSQNYLTKVLAALKPKFKRKLKVKKKNPRIQVTSTKIHEFLNNARQYITWIKGFKNKQSNLFQKILVGGKKRQQLNFQQLYRIYSKSLLRISSLILKESRTNVKEQFKRSLKNFRKQTGTGMVFRVRNKLTLAMVLRAQKRRELQLSSQNKNLKPIVTTLQSSVNSMVDLSPQLPSNKWVTLVNNSKTQAEFLSSEYQNFKKQTTSSNIKKLYTKVCLKIRKKSQKTLQSVLRKRSPKPIVTKTRKKRKSKKTSKTQVKKQVSYNIRRSKRERLFQKSSTQATVFKKLSVSNTAYLQYLANYNFGERQQLAPELLNELRNQLPEKNASINSEESNLLSNDYKISSQKNSKNIIRLTATNEYNYKYSKFNNKWCKLLLIKKQLKSKEETYRTKALLYNLLRTKTVGEKVEKCVSKIKKVIQKKTEPVVNIKKVIINKQKIVNNQRYNKNGQKFKFKKHRKKKRKGRGANLINLKALSTVPYFIRPRIISKKEYKISMKRWNMRRIIKAKVLNQKQRLKKKVLSKSKKAQIINILLKKYFKSEERAQILFWLKTQTVSKLHNKLYFPKKVIKFLKEYLKACYAFGIKKEAKISRIRELAVIEALIERKGIAEQPSELKYLEEYLQNLTTRLPAKYVTAHARNYRRTSRTVIKKKQKIKPRNIRKYKIKKSSRKVLEKIRSIYSIGVRKRFKYRKTPLSLKRSTKISRKILQKHRKAKKQGLKIEKPLILVSYYYYFKKLRYDRIVLDKLNYKDRELRMSMNGKSKLSKFLLYLLMRVYLKKSIYKRTDIRAGLLRIKKAQQTKKLALKLKLLERDLVDDIKGITSKSKKYIGVVKKTILIKVLIKVLRSLLKANILTKKEAKRRRKIKELIKIFLYPLLITKRQIQKVRLRKKNKIYLLMAQIFLYNIKQLVVSVNYSINFFGIIGSSITAEYVVRRLKERLELTKRNGSALLLKVMAKLMRSQHVVGCKVKYSGRLTGNSMAQQKVESRGLIGNSNMNVYIDYAQDNLVRKHGKCGLKLWIVRNLLTYMPYKYVYTYNF